MPVSLAVRPERPGDRDRVDAVVRAAFGGDEGDAVAGLVEVLRREPAEVAVTLVAEDAGGVVGHVGLSRGWLDAEQRLVEVQVLSPLAVRPDRQRRGVGRVLVEAAVAEAARRGAALVSLEGDPGYYRRLGFEPTGAHGIASPSTRIPAPACQVRLLPAYRPWMTGRLVYPDLFWRLDLVGLRGGRLERVRRALEDPG